MAFSDLPASAQKHLIKSFDIRVPDNDVDEMNTLMRLSKFPPETFETSHSGSKYGVTRRWMEEARSEFLNSFDWRAVEEHLNTFPHFLAEVSDESGSKHSVHFAALFSQNPGAIPILCLHGWPGSFLEFFPILSRLRSSHDPSGLPYHIIVPSLPGYAFSSGPPPTKDFNVQDATSILNSLATTVLGFSSYIAHGGDVGSVVARLLTLISPQCLGAHINYLEPDPATDDLSLLSDSEKPLVERNKEFITTGFAYALFNGTRSSTASFVLQSSPVALLAYIGEKMLSWPGDPLPLQTILEEVALYWLTNTISRSLYPYRQLLSGVSMPYIDKPVGFSLFKDEINIVPGNWAKKRMNLIFYRYHPSGGHFAALERPKELWGDVEEFVRLVMKQAP